MHVRTWSVSKYDGHPCNVIHCFRNSLLIVSACWFPMDIRCNVIHCFRNSLLIVSACWFPNGMASINFISINTVRFGKLLCIHNLTDTRFQVYLKLPLNFTTVNEKVVRRKNGGKFRKFRN